MSHDVENPPAREETAPPHPPVPQVTAHPIPHDGNAKVGGKCCGCCCDYRRAVIVVAIILAVLELIVLIFAASNAYLNLVCDTYFYDYGYYDGSYYDYGSSSYYDDPYYSDSYMDAWDTYIDSYGWRNLLNNPNECEQHFNGARITETIFSSISILLGIWAVWGALHYNVILVGLNAAWIIVSYVAGVIIAVVVCNSWDNKGSEYICVSFAASPGYIIVALLILALFLYPHIMFIVEVKKGILTRETREREDFSCCCTPVGNTHVVNATNTTAVVAPNPDPQPTAPGESSVTESYLPDGSKKIEVVTVNSDGSKTTKTTIIPSEKASI